ncbi:uncharacterized protein LOC127756520 [Oryza glaberrima]|uniref:uncharacterized protein LOC127756520 n=1 Tax=Oryza glaberrima TaxID=4538 RepID=UPI00224C02B6|nr:uncharacterized protein LOC127756520 [Oryza glaberrima]
MILQVPIIQDNSEDKLRWKFTPNGECNSKSAYKEIWKREASHGSQVSEHARTILKQVWKDKCMPAKIKAFAWRLLMGALPTASRLNFRISEISPNCIRCGMIENDFHLFLDCPFSKITWIISDINLNTDIFSDNVSMADIIACIVNNCSNKASLNRIFSIMWQIWKARNDLKFQGKVLEPTQVCFAAEAMINTYSCLIEQPHLQDNIDQSPSERRMEQLPEDTIFLMDCSTVVDTAKKGNFHEDPSHWSLLPIWSQILTFLPGHLLKVHWIPRHLNKLADKLAKDARGNPSSPPIFSCQNIAHIAYPSNQCFASTLRSSLRARNCTVNHVLCF